MTTPNLPSVIRAIIGVLRDVNYDSRDAVIADLERLKHDLWYVAPEAMGVRWQRLTSLLNAKLPKKHMAWTNTISALCSGAIDPEIYANLTNEDSEDSEDTSKDTSEKASTDDVSSEVKKRKK